MTHIVTQDDLIELTGSKLPRKQIEILSRHGIRFITRTDGKIRTTWNAVDSALKQEQKYQEQEPDLDFLRHG
ncbi:MAG: DUF4224 domain-containing protein [Methylomicrobium sp.]|nr:DUF4224 domain-containing protein [Methylomicrobium sp.]